MAERIEEHEHDPIVVVDDLEVDKHGAPRRWLWHLECCLCGQALKVDPRREPAA